MRVIIRRQRECTEKSYRREVWTRKECVRVKQNKSKKTRYIGELDSSNLFRNEFSKADKDSQIFFFFVSTWKNVQLVLIKLSNRNELLNCKMPQPVLEWIN